MSENMRYVGLCSICKNTSSCTFPRDPDKPVFHCEEFEIEKTVSIKPPVKELPPTPLMQTAKEKDSTRIIGLCSDCENRRSCAFPKPEGGIWQCEEYQ